MVWCKADGEQEEDKEGLFGGSFVSLCVREVRLIPRHAQQLRRDLPIGHHEHDEDEPEQQHQHAVEVGFPFGFAATLLILETFVIELFVFCHGNHGHQRHQ